MNNPETGKRVVVLFVLLIFMLPSAVWAQVSAGLRSFDDLFPGLTAEQKKEVFTENGYINALEKNGTLKITPAPGSGIDLRGAVMKSSPSYLVESLLVLPHPERRPFDRLDAYNATGRVRDLKGRLYHSFTRQAEVPLFEDATRLESAKRNKEIPDPPPVAVLPASETVYIRLKDINFGNCYYRGNVSVSPHGVTYNLTNYKNLTYFLFTVMKEERFSAILYMESLNEGMLVYSVAGADASDFIASKISIPSAIEKRLAVFIGWIGDGIKSGVR